MSLDASTTQHFMFGAMEEEPMQDCVSVTISAGSPANLQQWGITRWAGDIHFIKEDVKPEIEKSNPSVFDTGGN